MPQLFALFAWDIWCTQVLDVSGFPMFPISRISFLLKTLFGGSYSLSPLLYWCSISHRGGKLYNPHWCTNMTWNASQEQKKKQELPIRRASRPADSVVFSSCCEWGWHTKCSNGGTKLSKIIILQNVLRREIRAFMANNALTHAILKCWLFTWNILWTWCHWHPQHSPISNIFYPIQGCISSCTITILIYTFADPPEPRSSCSPVHSFHQVKRWACHTETQCHWEGRTRPSACGCLCLTSFFEPTRN